MSQVTKTSTYYNCWLHPVHLITSICKTESRTHLVLLHLKQYYVLSFMQPLTESYGFIVQTHFTILLLLPLAIS